MPPEKGTGAYDEPALTADETALVDAWEKGGAVPPAEDNDAAPISLADAAREAGQEPAPAPAATPVPPPPPPPPPASPPPPAPAPAAGDPPPAPAPVDEAADRAAFLEKHKDKSPAELADLLYQQSKRAGRAEFQGRQTQAQLQQIQTRAREALQRRTTDIQTRRAAFQQKLKDDPDAAALELHEAMLGKELTEAEQEERATRIDTALALAAQAIPDFNRNIVETLNFGQEMSYSREELGNITDGRDLVTLFLASRFANLVKAGVCDVAGNFLKAPSAIAEQPTDPRLNVPPAPATLTGSGRTGGGGATVDDQLAGMMALSDADFDKLDPAALESLLRQAV